jgi:hypothetical protein
LKENLKIKVLENKVTNNTIRWYGMNNDGIQVEVLDMKINGKHQRGIFRSRLGGRLRNMS